MADAASQVAVIQFPTADIIHDGKHINDRKAYRNGPLQELAASMAEHGLIQMILIRPVARLDELGRCRVCLDRQVVAGQAPEAGWAFRPIAEEWAQDRCQHTAEIVYEVVQGHRRFRAGAFVLGWETIPAIISDGSDEQDSMKMFIENVMREDLNPMDTSDAIALRMARYGYDVEEFARRSGMSPKMVKRRLLLQDLIPPLQEMVRSGALPVSLYPQEGYKHGELLAGLDRSRQQVALAFLTKKPNVGLEPFRRYVRQLEEEQAQASLFSLTETFLLGVQQYEEGEKAIWGKDAEVGVPTADRYRLIEIKSGEATGSIFERYIAQLSIRGMEAEAEAVGTLYEMLVRNRKVALPFATVGGGRV